MMKKRNLLLSMVMGLTACLTLGTPEAATAAASTGASDISSYGPNHLIKEDGSLWVWGGTKSVPTQVHGVSEIQASYPLWNNGALVTGRDGSVWKWETNARTMAIEVTPVPELKNVTHVQSSYRRNIAVTGEGTLYTSVTSPGTNTVSPFAPVPGIDHVAAVSQYYENNKLNNKVSSWQRYLFLKTDGTVWTSMDELATFKPVANLKDIVQLEQNYALSKNGSVWTWPVQNEYEPETQSDPAVVTATPFSGLTDIRALYNNGRSRLAVDVQSRLWFWGSTVTGYSDGTTYQDEPVPVVFSGISKVTDAYIVEQSIVALTSDGKVYAASIAAELMSPNAKFTLLASGIQSMQGGGRHIIMQKQDGTLWGWGVNKDAELGYGTYEFSYKEPVPMQQPISVTLNGESIAFTNGVITRSSLNFIPLRSLFSKMGATVGYSMDKVVTITGTAADKSPLSIVINTVTGATTVNGKSIPLPTPPFVVNGTVYLPLRFISEQLGAKVEWLPQEGRIAISSK
ncbi:copper amine oxidase [Paenibacillus tritici]|uniref:Copper amine oxidase n=1 Tax=Paenibacillus tritici TaxID=1873425 RepID=A0ABX2DWB9_9BACL|nr:stalk domain-containing protein [Paenibacillus tritici]NQX48685.1 copper amine oxidase [Paenibacillus tritici]